MKYSGRTMRVLMVFIVSSICYMAKATGQSGEIIIIGNEEFEMLSLPLRSNRKLIQGIEAIEGEGFDTSCWRGYGGEWEIRNDTLYLIHLYSIHMEEDVLPLLETSDTYRENRRLEASWFSGELRVVKGDYIYYEHAGFHRYYENETIYTVEKGIITEKKDYHTYPLFLPEDIPSVGIAQSIAIDQARKCFNKEQFPELSNKNLIYFNEIEFTEKGQISPDSKISVSITTEDSDENIKIEDTNHPYIQEWIRCLNQTSVWPILIVHDKVFSNLKFGMPF